MADLNAYTFCRTENFAWTNRGKVARGEQPSLEALKCLRDAGFGAVVNLRAEAVGFDEEAAVIGLSMRYLHIPIDNDKAPSPQQVVDYMDFVESCRSAGIPVFTHCAGGRGRTGVMDAIYLLRNGWQTSEVFKRFAHFGAKLGCDKAGNGQVQALHEIGILLGRGDAWPEGADVYGTVWQHCDRPKYMASWEYRTD